MMIKKLKLRGLFIYLLLCVTVMLGAEDKETYALESLLIGADALGRGGSYITAENGVSPVFQNFAISATPCVSLTAFRFLGEVDYLSAAYTQNGFSFGFLTVQDSAGYGRDAQNNLTGGQIRYSDATLYAAYGLTLDRLSLGARLKHTEKDMSGIARASGQSLDLSLLDRLNEYWSFGLGLNNIFRTTLRWSGGREEAFPSNAVLGGKYSVFGLAQILNFYLNLNLEDRELFQSGGVEWWLAELLALRLGFSQFNAWQNEQEVKDVKLTAGLGFRLYNMSFDYAYDPGEEIAENVTHFFTLGYIFPAGQKKQEQKQAEDTANSVTESNDEDSSPKNYRRRIYKDIGDLPLDEQLIIEDLGYLNIFSKLDDPERPVDATDKP
jgi:hypothetical protein